MIECASMSLGSDNFRMITLNENRHSFQGIWRAHLGKIQLDRCIRSNGSLSDIIGELEIDSSDGKVGLADGIGLNAELYVISGHCFNRMKGGILLRIDKSSRVSRKSLLGRV